MPDFRQTTSWNARRSLRRGSSWIAVLWLAVCCAGCKESPPLVKEGALFVASEKAPPAKALVYIYWPREEQGKKNHLWVGPCNDLAEEILPGGYIALTVEPGPSCFKAEARSDFINTNTMTADLIQDLGSIELSTEPGRTFFIRLETKPPSLMPQTALRQVKPDIAGPEISSCRRSILLTGDEFAQQFLEQSGR